MRNPVFVLALLLLDCAASVMAQEIDSLPDVAAGAHDFRVYTRQGAPSSLEAILAASDASEVLLIGEEHDDLVGHRIEETLFAGAIDRRGSVREDDSGVVLSLEMFERDVQYVIDEYLQGQISEDHFLGSSRPWDDYEDRYRGLVELARDRGVPLIAANAPRRYVNRVTREGPESLAELTALARSFLPPLPYPGASDAYRAQWDTLMAEARAAMRAPAQADSAESRGYERNPNALWAQALWDASMGHSITRALDEWDERLVIHIAGSFHVERGTGILERIEGYRPGSRVVTVVMTKVGDLDAWRDDEHGDLADFVVLTLSPDAKESRRP